mmetsp:Transcript_67031/g.199346  ORF Transcript_67031/g.199346 Transcript_67031/m.199346 type:complete len:214 (-) Transcript_67031:636-1277(-)
MPVAASIKLAAPTTQTAQAARSPVALCIEAGQVFLLRALRLCGAGFSSPAGAPPLSCTMPHLPDEPGSKKVCFVFLISGVWAPWVLPATVVTATWMWGSFSSDELPSLSSVAVSVSLSSSSSDTYAPRLPMVWLCPLPAWRSKVASSSSMDFLQVPMDRLCPVPGKWLRKGTSSSNVTAATEWQTSTTGQYSAEASSGRPTSKSRSSEPLSQN